MHVSFQTRNEKRTEITGFPAFFTPITEEATSAPSKYRRCYQPADTYNIVDVHRVHKTLQKPDADRVGVWRSGCNGSEWEQRRRKWLNKIRESAHIFRACATWRMEKNTAGKSVVTQEVKTLRSRVNVITWPVRSRLGSSLREVPLAWPAENDRVDQPVSRLERRERRGEMSKEHQL